ncbi:winged helix-turn-helix domain-containing protein [Foetidibacter luteolus]|uniref:winged helix-turn-helix domain-containing protein n=1 Tax=Foetidibacter luteolus TaxID=2608880 RepID=UPI00129A78DA|nr:LysR family transcriptional regulator [Foetidibacter luteolus]
MVTASVKSILSKKSSYKVNGSLWIECEGERFFGLGRVELLQRIDETGSINKAAKLMNMSYKKAWEMINALNSQAAAPFVITQTGGEKGGGSVITDEARQLISYHKNLRQRFAEFLERETGKLHL